jgi:hypothetical protein
MIYVDVRSKMKAYIGEELTFIDANDIIAEVLVADL